MANMNVNIAGTVLSNPLIAASGTFGFGREYAELYPLSKLGGISCKGTTLRERLGNPPPRIAETPSGMLNSVGLQNPGIEHFVRKDLPWMRRQGTAVIANIAGATVEDYCEAVSWLWDEPVDAVELNISCPNVKKGGAAFGSSAASAAGVTRAVRSRCRHPLWVKLSPNVADIASIAQAVEAEGADAVCLINTLTGMRIDINTRRPILRNNTGGMSGPAVFPIAVRMVWETARRVRIPVIGMGGISTWQDAVEMMLAGASAFQVGTAILSDPYAPLRILEGLEQYLDEQGIAQVSDLTGAVRAWE